MKKFEYKMVRPHIERGEFIEGYDKETVSGKGFFGGEKTEVVYKKKTISEQTWLNRQGEQGWELVSVIRSSMNYDIREYYFKREIKQQEQLSVPDIRNKLSPISNLITMIENGLVKGDVELHDLVLKEIEQCKQSINHLSQNSIAQNSIADNTEIPKEDIEERIIELLNQANEQMNAREFIKLSESIIDYFDELGRTKKND